MSWSELSRLKPVAPSMGMMLETTSRRLFETKGLAHYGSPDKDPTVRLRTLDDAGRLSMPFTTGLLVGIGETLTERAETMHAIRRSHKEFGHVQEVIVQNFRAKDHTAMAGVPDTGHRRLPGDHRRHPAGAGPEDAHPGAAEPGVARRVPGADRRRRRRLGRRVAADARSRQPRTAVARARRTGRRHRRGGLRPGAAADRAAAVRAGRRGVDRPAGARPRRRAGRSRDRVRARRQPGRAAVAGARRGDRVAGPHRPAHRDRHRGPAAPRPAATWAARSATGSRSGRRCNELAARAPERIDTDVLAALRSAERNPAGCSDDEYLALATADGPALDAVAALADSLRRDVVGDDVTFVVNRNINFTNICYTGCRFCAFAQRKGDADAFSLSTDEVADRAWEAHVAGATEVCMQGGIDPELPVTGYADLVRAVKARVPSMHVHAFSPDGDLQRRHQERHQSIREWLTSLREAGLGSIPGTAAEILDDEVRWVLTKGKLPTSAWIEVITTAHEVGLRSSSTMMYGHVDTPRHWVGHLNVLRDIQDRTGGFTEFVPLPFVHQSSPLYLAGGARPGPDAPRQPRRARAGANHVARQDLQHPDQLGQARRRAHAGDAQRRRQRSRRHADGGDHLADGGLGERLGQVRRGTRRDRRGHRPPGPPAHHDLRRRSPPDPPSADASVSAGDTPSRGGTSRTLAVNAVTASARIQVGTVAPLEPRSAMTTICRTARPRPARPRHRRAGPVDRAARDPVCLLARGPATAGVAGAGASPRSTTVLTPLTTERRRVAERPAGASVSPILQEHAERGDWMIYFSVALLVVAVALAVLHWLEDRSDAPKRVADRRGRRRRARRRGVVDRDGGADRRLGRAGRCGATGADGGLGRANQWV